MQISGTSQWAFGRMRASLYSLSFLIFFDFFCIADITMYETLLRPYEVHVALPPLRPVSAIAADLRKAAAVREQKRLQQIANAQAKRAQNPTLGGKKRKRGAQQQTNAAAQSSGGESKNECSGVSANMETSDLMRVGESEGEGLEAKKLRTEDGNGEDGHGVEARLASASVSNPDPAAAFITTIAAPENLSAATGGFAHPGVEQAQTKAQQSSSSQRLAHGSLSPAAVTVVPEPPQALKDDVHAHVADVNANANVADDTGKDSTAADQLNIDPDVDESEPEAASTKLIVSKMVHDVRGHTSYLTFAVLLPTGLSHRTSSGTGIDTGTGTSEPVSSREDGGGNGAVTGSSTTDLPPSAASPAG